jgi:HPt (histidine-containing phosphotransfer) domain-containing protein
VQLHAAPAELEKAMRQKDIHRLQQIGHRLKGSVSSAKMYRLEALSRQLEEQQQFEEDMLGKLVGEICEEIRLVLRRAEEILGSRV